MKLPCRAQPAGTGSWNLLNIKYSLSQNWSLFAEGQLRSLKFYGNFHYYEYKGGVDFKANKSLKLSMGAGSYQTYREGGNFEVPKNNDEFRLWPQLVLFQSIGRFKIEQRYRTEMRFTSSGYRNRFRYRLGISLPFGRAEHEVRPFQLSISNELFFTDNEPYFERNRLLFALQYKVSESTCLQLGYLHLFDYKINDETGRSFLVAALYFEIFRNSGLPPSGDLEIQNN